MSNNSVLAVIAAALLLAGCGESTDADIVFIGDHIISMDSANPQVQAVAVRGDRIVLAGGREQAMALVGEDTRVVELGERALLPGFIDAHGHFAFTARLIDFVNLSSPPVGPVESVEDILLLLRARIQARNPEPGTWVLGYGYDDSLLQTERHPNRDDLDKVSTEHPIILLHVSGHLSTMNSAGLAAVGYTAETEDPPGGVIRRRTGSHEPNGVLEESASAAVFFRQLAAMSQEQFAAQVQQALAYYASFGVTTVQDGAASLQDVEALRALAEQQPFSLDIASYPYFNRMSTEQAEVLDAERHYRGGFRVAGVKFVLDGSPQGRTAWLTKPYLERPSSTNAGYSAYPTTDPDVYRHAVAKFIGRGVPVLAHANGDAAIDLMLEGVAAALKQMQPGPDHRSVSIHSQLMRADQLDVAKELGVIPSFFSAHTFFWGDWHRRSFGDLRASNISPTRWALDRQLPFTIHNDTPIVPPDMMRLLWATVTRITRSGHSLGPDQRLSVEQALHAMTLGAAYQYFEENNKGSLTEGKQADMVILGSDPRAADPQVLKDIPILETIARGQTVFTAFPVQ